MTLDCYYCGETAKCMRIFILQSLLGWLESLASHFEYDVLCVLLSYLIDEDDDDERDESDAESEDGHKLDDSLGKPVDNDAMFGLGGFNSIAGLEQFF
ncbi:hypothetical protein J1614_008863 [Plenodomus biglobosus]|nr:hypothetical protein J1614_008863 [Plenodomus biglobosus]